MSAISIRIEFPESALLHNLDDGFQMAMFMLLQGSGLEDRVRQSWCLL